MYLDKEFVLEKKKYVIHNTFQAFSFYLLLALFGNPKFAQIDVYCTSLLVTIHCR